MEHDSPAPASRWHRVAELDDGMAALFASDGPALLHIHCDAELA